jgi:hypothetical protein
MHPDLLSHMVNLEHCARLNAATRHASYADGDAGEDQKTLTSRRKSRVAHLLGVVVHRREAAAARPVIQSPQPL